MSIYNIYISNFMDPTGEEKNPISTERLLFTIPFHEDDYPFTDPVIKVEMGKTGSFEFSIDPLHPYYNSWLQMETMLRVEYAGTTLFRGRVLTIDNSPMTGVKKIHLEGDFAFFMDSYQEGIKDDDLVNRSLENYLEAIINSHNNQMDVAKNICRLSQNYKKIYLGEVPGHYTSVTSVEQRIKGDTRKFGGSSWRRTSDALSELQAEFGGYFRTRYGSDGKCYLDWLEYYFNPVVNEQPIELKENLIDLSSTTEVENLFTALIPIGSKKGESLYIDGYKTDIHGNNKYILVPHIVKEYTDAELNRGYHSKADYENAVDNYGIIFATQNFGNADTKAKLWSYATDWIKNNYVGGISSFTISAFDMHHVDTDAQPYFVGDQIRVIYPNTNAHSSEGTPTIEKTLTITAIQYDLYHPEKNTYDVGIPNSILNKTYGKPSKTSSKGGASAKVADKPSGGGIPQQPTPEETDASISKRVWDYIVDKTYNNDQWIELKQENPDLAKKILTTSHMILTDELKISDETSPEEIERIKNERKIWINAPNTQIKMYNGSPIWKMTPKTEELLRFHEQGHTIVIDGEKNLLTLSQRVQIDPYDPVNRVKNFPDRRLIQISGNASNDPENKETPTIMTWGINKVLGENPLTDASPSMLLDGGTDSDTGNGSFGFDNLGNWITTFNKAINWEDEDGKHTMLGGIHAEDFHLDSVGSVGQKFLAVEKAIIGKASIGQLEAVDGRITTLVSKAITTDNLSVKLSAYAKDLGARNIVCSDVSTTNLHVHGSGTFSSSITVGDYTYTHRTKSVVTNVTFDQASGTISQTKENIYYFGHT